MPIPINVWIIAVEVLESLKIESLMSKTVSTLRCISKFRDLLKCNANAKVEA